MKRSTVIVDRAGCAIAGSVLIAMGVGAVAWECGKLPGPRGGALSLPWLPSAADSLWWPFALGSAAIVLVLIGLRWLFSHRPGQKLSSAALPGSGAAGRLSVDVNTAASAAAADLAGHPVIAAASGTTVIDRGQPVIELDVTIETTAGSLGAAVAAVQATQRDLAAALNGASYNSRVLLRTARRTKASRVR